MSLHSVCRSDELGIGEMKAFAVGTQKIVLYHLTNGFFATQANCTHMFAPLAPTVYVPAAGSKVAVPGLLTDPTSPWSVKTPRFPSALAVEKPARKRHGARILNVEVFILGRTSRAGRGFRRKQK